ncbi:MULTISPECIES: secondary thiamine-phosphate synthase enzyme YjbQ [Desulfosporosinus]|uniref:Secondary thiamine-phosphate synthase enzyme n=1 Tax=Desulfosporosinus meridiei (strain ATCC BAA-275 / DSM 13257 / KCTC 12902 / NCIMB 13706 / S10) TaxID=768704 RepID=J7IXH3_DESMD|nr:MULTISPECIES: secondary thiamine-phosphate synthase enzyme YjbQ [Desulfosporosinus]AFQ43798.1 secondary thiamine-phosphate synthase enzyme [Desulfosporosinus meridiei DSM 13257]MCB8815375.1 secondary thiamine-phosphate synthase enzyme YjbQ [Desulfosporosinus sp. SRJS8]
MIHEIHLKTKRRDEMLDITARVQNLLAQENILEGQVVIFSSHTTAGITINENADPDVQKDILRRLDEIYPWEMNRDRHLEGNSAAHLKTSTVGTSQTVIVHNGKLLLGRWQGIYFCEFDGPRERTCYVKILK